jgi:lysophospholipase L1-like esterase
MRTRKLRKLVGLMAAGLALVSCGGKNTPGQSRSTVGSITQSGSGAPPYTISDDGVGPADGQFEIDPPTRDEETGAQRFELPKSMAALGDSITAGFLAHLKRGDYLHSSQIMEEIQLGWDLYRYRKDMLGVVEKKGFSWSTGVDSDGEIKSHAYRLQKLQGSKMKLLNAAVSGSEARDLLEDQLGEVLDWSRTKLGKGAPDYVTVMVGPNDICADKVSQMTPSSDYQARVSQVVGSLLAAGAGTRVMISSVPDVERLRGAARTARAFIGPQYTCEELWEDLNVCPTITRTSDYDDRRLIAQRVVEYNQALKKIAADYSRAYGDRVRFASSVYDYKLSKDDISIDCFHPNPRGQNQIAERAFNAGWWKDEWIMYKAMYASE